MFQFDWTKHFQVSPETEMLTNKRTNEPIELHQFRQEPSYDGDLSPCQV